jgi:hypothetical protein
VSIVPWYFGVTAVGEVEDPFEIPEWHSIGRESALVRQLLGSGITALGRANYADKSGDYYTAFFNLSVGLERLGKLILVADHAITTGGLMPEQKLVSKYSHRLGEIINAIDEVAERRKLKLRFARPISPISLKIVECLDAFADARRGRYANFVALGDPNLGKEEPIRKWWDHVAESILKQHYYGKDSQKRVEARARIADAMMSPISYTLFFNETGDAMQDTLSASIRTGQTEIVQRYGRYYTLTVVRWLAEVFSRLCEEACYTHHVGAFFGVWEYFHTYTVDDRFLKQRKIWPLS